jgi:hypothetical protein
MRNFLLTGEVPTQALLLGFGSAVIYAVLAVFYFRRQLVVVRSLGLLAKPG